MIKKQYRFLLIATVFAFIFTVGTLKVVFAQPLESDSYKINDSEIGSVGEVSESTNYKVTNSFNPLGDPGLESTSYGLRAGFPNGIQANVPIIICFETTTTAGTTNCTSLPNSAGMVAECGYPGCYNKAKLEIDDQDNPKDALYLVALSPDSFVTTYYLQSDHTIDTTYDINDYMTQCQLEGKDSDDTDCDDSGDINWDADLQSANILGLSQNTAYEIKIRALHGDFTESEYSPVASATTEVPTISMDIDVAVTNTESAAPYVVEMGELVVSTVNTASESIWLDLATNWSSGISSFVRDTNEGLESASTLGLLPSESEDLATDPNDNGGFGLRTQSVSQTSLGPLQRNATYYNASQAHYVGALSTTSTLFVYTDTTGVNKGPIFGGRAQVQVKARPIPDDPAASDYTDEVTILANLNP